MSRVLTDIEFKAFTMFMDGVTIAEICEMTGKSPKSVDNAIQRSKKKLINALKTNNEG
jgi:DNA-directed RNA polymerase specialized sigma24 family protein